MPAKKKQSWLEKNWPFRHTETRLNADTNLIKLVAMITMLIDHLGAAVFPQYRILRVIGRVAFPIYAYCIAVGCAYTRNIGRYLERLAILALISQPIYVLALHHTNSLMYACSFAQAPLRAAFSFYVYSWKDPSILLTLMVGVGAIWVLRERKLFTLLLVLLLTYLLKDSLDYGLKGVFLMLLFYMFLNAWYLSLPLVAAYMLWWGLQGGAYHAFGLSFGIQIFALLALPLIYIPMRSEIRLNKWLFYAFYPAHLCLIYLIERWGDLMNLIFG